MKIRNLLFSILILGMCLLTSGCSSASALKEFTNTQLPSAIRDRAEVNKRWASQFKTIGAISEEQYESVIKNIDKQVEKYTATDEEGNVNEDILSLVAQAVSQYTIGGKGNPSYIVTIETDEEGNKKMYNSYYIDPSYGGEVMQGDLVNYIMSNYLHSEIYKQPYKGAGEIVVREEKDIEPIELMSEDVMESLNKLTKAELYILRTDIMTTSGANELDGLMAKIQDAVNEKNDTKKQSLLSNYFIKAVDYDGNPIHVIDENDQSYDLIGNSKANDGSKNEPGYDLIIGQYDMDDCLHVRFTEFNAEAYNKLSYFIGLDFGKLMLVPDSEGAWKAYLMVYPISVIDSLYIKGEDDTKYDFDIDTGGYDNIQVELKESGLGVNLMTGQFIKFKYDEATGSFDTNDGKVIDTDEYYLTLNSAQNNDANAISSLVVNGITTTKVKDTNDVDYDFYCGRIILRDYLEATFAPGYREDNNLVVFGRKIRMDMSNTHFHEDPDVTYKLSGGTLHQTNLVYERGTPAATFVDINGEEVVGSPQLEITDFCDAEALNRDVSDCVVTRLPYKNEEEAINNREVTSSTPDISDLSIITSSHKIHPVIWFPSPYIGKVDYNTDSITKQRFYCLATTKGLFQSALYSNWIISEASEASLDWWNKYLSDNGFDYNVGKMDVMNYLTGNYSYQLTQNGVVILNLETVATIQKMFNEEDNANRVSFIKTIFVLTGWTMIGMSFLFMLFWVADTNTDIGLGILEKATMGHWVAVKYEDDIPTHNVNEQAYLTFRLMFKKVLIFIAVGILLINIDVFVIVRLLVETFGGFASTFEKLIKGLQ